MGLVSSKAARKTEYLIMNLEIKYQVLGFFITKASDRIRSGGRKYTNL